MHTLPESITKMNANPPNKIVPVDHEHSRMALAYRMAYDLEFKNLDAHVKSRVLQAKGDDNNRDPHVTAFIKRVLIRAENPEGADLKN